MSIYKCNRCPYTTASHFLLKEHEFSTHVQNIKIDPNSPRAPTSVSFGPDVAKAPHQSMFLITNQYNMGMVLMM